jgi:hypothetical protein
MAKQLGRWSVSDVAGIGADRIGPRVGERSMRRKPTTQYVHVHLPRSYTCDQSLPQARTEATSSSPSGGGYPIADGDLFRASDCGDCGFALQRVPTSRLRDRGTARGRRDR